MKTLLDNSEMQLVRDILRILLNHTDGEGGLLMSQATEKELTRTAEELNRKLAE